MCARMPTEPARIGMPSWARYQSPLSSRVNDVALFQATLGGDGYEHRYARWQKYINMQ